MYYDCPFIDATDDGRIFNVDFEFSSTNSIQIKKYILKVPSYVGMSKSVSSCLLYVRDMCDLDDNGGLKTHELFTYIDYTNPSCIVLKIQTLEPAFNVTDYKIEVWRERDEKATKMDVGFLDVASAINGELTYSYNTWQEWGDYYFLVSFVNKVCPEEQDLCAKTFTPKISIGE